jgi:hypothetical protein
MGWFNPLKGAYPSLQQIDKVLAVASGESGIVRGSCLYAHTDNTWKLATASDDADAGKYIYWALQGQDDFQAGMAGSIGQGPGGVWNGSHASPAVSGSGAARVAAIACGMPGEYETDQYDTAQVYAVGDLLKPGASGKMTQHSTGKNCIGQVTKVVTTRWVNDAIAVTGRRTGANTNVLTFRSLWVPLMTT